MTSSICTCRHHLNSPSLMTLAVIKLIEQKTWSVGIQPPIWPYQWTRENTSNLWLDWYRVPYVVFRLVFLTVPVCLYLHFLFDIFCFLIFSFFFSKLHTRQELILRKGFCSRMMKNQSSVTVLFHVTVVGWSIMCLWFIAIYSLFYSLHIILIYASCWYLMFVLFQSSPPPCPFTFWPF